MPEPIFQPLPDKPDHPGLEQEMLARWDAEETFSKLREQNRGGPTFSFVDGPVTANRMSLGVHTAWGRTLKDVFQRYKALRGFDERYQNGFDCQGLWIEVGVERSLGLNSKREIEEFGLEEFARRCREVVVQSSEALTRGSIRLGQWMDWGRDYFTFSDTNIEYIWKFLKIVHGRGWLYMGHRATEWCPRCGTSLSQHELTQGGVYQERADPSLFVRFPLLDFEGQSVVIWTTTPWTLPANVAAAVHPDEEYGRRANGEWVAVKLFPEDTFVERLPGRELVGRRYQGPFDDLPPGSQVEHRVIPWEDVTMDQGTGVVHIAPGAGGEDFELSRVHDLPVLSPVDESGRFYDDYGWLHGLTTTEAADQIIGRLGETGFLAEAGLFTHAYPHCWRCDTPLIFRLSDDWFIAVDEIRPTLLDENAKVEWVPEYMGKRMDDWLRNMGDWNISRRRYYGLPLPFYPCSCGHLNIIGSRGELEERALGGLEQLEELRRPWIDRVPIRCESCGEPVERIPEVGDVWLDAGIVPFATLGWENPQWVEEGYATGAARGLTKADLPDHEYWEKWFPADWVSEMREQIRLWFYSQFFMSVALVGRSPYQRVLGYEKMLDEQGREMHASWGNTIPAEDAFARMGADVMRWQYCAQPPERNLLFGFGPAETIKREFLTFWNSVKFFVDYANIADFRSSWSALNLEGVLDPLDRWLVERTHAFVRDAETAYEGYLTVDVMRAYTEYTEDLSNWYIRRSRRRFWDGDDHAPFQTLWYAIAQTLRVMAPILPFVTDHLWRTLVLDGPESVHLAGWPEVPEPDEELLEEVAEVRTVVRLAHQARAVSGQRLRQPFRHLATKGAERSVQRWWDVIADEVRVKQHSPMPVTKFQLKPNLKTLGPRLGKDLRVVQEALSTSESIEQLPDGSFRVNGFDLTEDDVLSANRVSVDPDWVVAEEGDISVALDTKLDDDLLLEARALDLVRTVNQLRKDEGLELTDRIVLTVPDSEADVVNRHREYVEQEVLATELRVAGDVLTLEKS